MTQLAQCTLIYQEVNLLDTHKIQSFDHPVKIQTPNPPKNIFQLTPIISFTIQQIKPFSCATDSSSSIPFVIMLAKPESDQLQQLREIFTRFDMDSDGSLTQLELAALLRSLGLKPKGDQIHALLANMDANGNGLIEFNELVEVILPNVDEEVLISQDQLMEVFRSFDRDGNGYITATELAGQMAKMGHPLTYRELSEMMRDADEIGDGVISFNEFTSIMGKSAVDFLGITVS